MQHSAVVTADEQEKMDSQLSCQLKAELWHYRVWYLTKQVLRKSYWQN
jgi:hypothetical protein